MSSRKLTLLAGVLCLSMAAFPGCVTKKKYGLQVEDTDGRIRAVESAVEANEKRIGDMKKQTDARLGKVESEAGTALKVGNQAISKADNASTVANKAYKGKLIWDVTLTDDNVKFAFGKASLSSDGMANLDKLVSKMKSYGRALYVEIEGHTDSVGTEQSNMMLGQKRADVAYNYLAEKGGIPLHAMNTLSLGESRPIADNSTSEGRAQNRRVVVRVLE